MKRTIEAHSPAKVNLMLKIVKKREDGYHEIRTIFQKISLHDTLRFTLREEPGIRIRTSDPNLSTGKENLIYRAASAVLQRSAYGGGVSIALRKRIPVGAGLGGGSSNAATTLKALNLLLNLNLSPRKLMDFGLRIGADVPFFLMEGSALGAGIGERLRKIDLPELWYVLINPGFEVSTAWAYEHHVLTKERIDYNIHKFPRIPEEVAGILWNDLEGVVSRAHPEISAAKEILFSEGALGALMTGSGPTVFGIFGGQGGASKAYKKIRAMVTGEGWVVLKAQSIAV
jgi:4-diphosphocytidyl-2-C-methyl-D-erythritol kinase